ACIEGPHEQHQQHHTKSHEAYKRPVGNRAAQEGPVNRCAIARTTEDHGDGAADGIVLDHSVKIAATGSDLGWIPLEPALAGSHKGTEAGCDQREHAPTHPPAFGASSACQACEDCYANKSVPLHD